MAPDLSLEEWESTATFGDEAGALMHVHFSIQSPLTLEDPD